MFAMTPAFEFTGLSIGLAAFGAAIALAAGGMSSEATTPRTPNDHSSFLSFSASCTYRTFPGGGRLAVDESICGNGSVALGGATR